MKRIITAVLGSIALVLAVMCTVSVATKDKVAPEITVASGDLVYDENKDRSELLKVVTASDDEDGDISSKVRVHGISITDGGTKAVVTYAVYDSSYNMTKVTVEMDYIPATIDESVSQDDEN